MADMIPSAYKASAPNDSPQPNTWRRTNDKLHRIFMPITVGLPDDYEMMLHDCLDVLFDKLSGNMLRFRYYDSKNVLKDFGISTPPQLLSVETVVGWPQKAVDALATRSRLQGFEASDEGVQGIIDSVARRSRLSTKYRQAVQSELIHSCCFATVGMSDGEPRIDIFSAERASAIWDDAKGRIAYGMTVDDFDRNGNAIAMSLYTDDAVVRFTDPGNGYWDWEVEHYSMGRPTMEAFAYRPTYNKPFGQSRITRAVMSITDSAVRCALGGDISFQFSVSPQKYLLGADRDAFEQVSKWEAYIGNIFSIGRSEDNDLPVFGQLTQGSMQQYETYMRNLAARFSGETNVPVSQLGVIHDNPASAEAIYAANEPLIIECEDLNDGSQDTLRSLMNMAIAAKNDKPLSELTDEETDFQVRFKNPAMPSIVSQADAAIKINSAAPWFSSTPTFWAELGYDEDTVRMLMDDKQRIEARQMMMAQEQAAAMQPQQNGSAIDNTQNFYRIMSIVKDYSAGRATGQVAKRMLESLGLTPDEAEKMLKAQDGGEEIEVPEDIIKE